MSNVVRLSDVIAGFGKSLLDAQRQVDACKDNIADVIAFQAGVRRGTPGEAPETLVKPGVSTPESPSQVQTTSDLPMETAATDPMRVLSRLRCDECGHDWQQPAAAGLCPRCHSTDVRCEERRVCVNKRV